MKQQKWLERYRDSLELLDESVDVLTGFNANIDVIHQLEDLGLELEDIEPELVDPVENLEDLKSSLKHCVEKGENHEVDIKNFEEDLGEGKEYIGGQGGIMSNYLAGTGNGVIFYTPLLSEELAQKIDEKVLYPVIDGNFVLKNVRDAANTDRLKKNRIIEFESERTGRLILSDSLKGFGPYFRKGVEDNLEEINDNIDCAVLSGFHDAEGNSEAKLKKSATQLEKITRPIHLEYAHKKDELAQLIIEHVVPKVDSLGLDETELKKILRVVEKDDIEGEISFGEAFQYLKNLIERFDLSRIHLHTFRYHITVTEADYHASKEEIRKAMLYGEASAVQTCEGELPNADIMQRFDPEAEKVEMHSLQELEDFEEFFHHPHFSETGIAEIDGYQVIGIPTLIHQEPKRTVGAGDVISSGAFTSEFK